MNKWFLVFVGMLVLAACSKDVEVNNETLRLSVLGDWTVKSVLETKYLNGNLSSQTTYNAPLDSFPNYSDYVTMHFTKDSVFFLNADSTQVRDIYTITPTKLVLHHTDSLGYLRSENIIRLTRADVAESPAGIHRDTLIFSFVRK